MAQALAITGTDTGVGKTFIARGLCQLALRAGARLRPLKLVETGCLDIDGQLLGEDAQALARAAGRPAELDLISPFRFALPAAPTVAARAEGKQLTFAEFDAALAAASTGVEHVLLEGAGGLLVPFAEDGDFADYLQRGFVPVTIVARDRLGTLNHSLLTIEAARRRGLDVRALILCASGPERCELDHARELSARLPHVPVLGPIPWQPDADDEAIADSLALAGLSWDALW